MFKINTAAAMPFTLVDAGTGNALTGATVTAYRSIDGGSQASAAGSVTELGNGQYVFNATAADMNCSQSVGFLFLASGAIPVHVTIAPDSKVISDLHDLAAGSQMDLVNSPNATAITALKSGLATGAEISTLQSHGDSAWATATGFALASVWTSGLANVIATNLDTNVGSRSTFAGGAVASVTAAVTVGGYASGQDPASLVLDVAAPAHNSSGSVGARISAMQQSGAAVTLPSNPPSGFLGTAAFGSAPGWYTSPPTAAQVATSVWTDTTSGDFLASGSPGKLLVATGVTVATNNDKSGYSLSSAGLDDIATSEPSGTVSDWNFRQRLLALFARFFNRATAPDSGNGTLTVYQRDDDTLLSAQTVSDDGTLQTQGGA